MVFEEDYKGCIRLQWTYGVMNVIYASLNCWHHWYLLLEMQMIISIWNKSKFKSNNLEKTQCTASKFIFIHWRVSRLQTARLEPKRQDLVPALLGRQDEVGVVMVPCMIRNINNINYIKSAMKRNFLFVPDHCNFVGTDWPFCMLYLHLYHVFVLPSVRALRLPSQLRWRNPRGVLGPTLSF